MCEMWCLISKNSERSWGARPRQEETKIQSVKRNSGEYREERSLWGQLSMFKAQTEGDFFFFKEVQNWWMVDLDWSSNLITLNPLLRSSPCLFPIILAYFLYVIFCLSYFFLGLFSCSEQSGFLEWIFHYDSHQPEKKIKLLCASLSPVCSYLYVEREEERGFLRYP